MSAPTSAAPLVVNTRDGMCWTRRTVTSSGIALYAPEGVCSCPEFVMATYAELEERGIVGVADALPMRVGPEAEAYLAPSPSCTRCYGADAERFVAKGGATSPCRACGPSELERLRVEVEQWRATYGRDSLPGALARLERAESRVAELETAPLAWAERLDAKSLDNLLISLGSATEHEPMGEAIAQIHQVLAGFREVALGLPVPPAPEPQSLPWAHAMSDHDLHGFLDDLVSAAMGRWRSEPEVPDRTVLADIEKVCAAWRTPGLGLRLDGSEFDGAVVRLAPSRAAEVPDGEHYASVHHAYRLGHDLPETGGAK